MNVDELASAFEAVNGAGSRIDHARYVGEHVGLFLDEPETVRLVPPLDPAAARDLRDLIEAAVVVFGLDGPGTAEERWCRFVLEHAPRLVESEPAAVVRLVGHDGTHATVTELTARIHDAAKASARVVRKCRHLVRAEPPAPGKVDASPPSVEDAEPPAGRATRLTPAVALAGASFEWVCSERPNLVKMHSPGRRSPTKQQYEHIKEYGCEAYPGGEGESIPSFETWARHVRGYLKEKDGRVRSSRSGRTGRSIATPSEL